MRHFATTKTHGDLHLVAVFKKLEHIAHLYAVIMFVRIRAKLDFLDLDDLLLFARFGFTFLLFVFVLAEIHDLTHGRVSIWGNLHQIQSSLLGLFHGCTRRYNAAVFTIGTDQSNFGGINAFIHARASFTHWRGVVGSAGYSAVPSVVFIRLCA